MSYAMCSKETHSLIVGLITYVDRSRQDRFTQCACAHEATPQRHNLAAPLATNSDVNKATTPKAKATTPKAKATTLKAKATYLKAKNTTVSTGFIPDN